MSRQPEWPGWVPPATPVVQRGGLRARLNVRTAALALIGIGLVTCLVPVGLVGYGMWQENQLTQSWSTATILPSPPFIDEGSPSPGSAPPSPTPAATPRAAPAGLQALFAIRVPKIGYFAAVREGESLDILATGPGHYPGTALPGQPGLIAIAAHNTFWIAFGQLGRGDTIVLETLSAKFTYQVTATRVINPDDRTVLLETPDPHLVLTTCWPLWAGNLAPQRLAILAKQV